MADKKLNESKIVKDMDYVLVTLADGSVGQIAKSDLASVVAACIAKAMLLLNLPILPHRLSVHHY